MYRLIESEATNPNKTMCCWHSINLRPSYRRYKPCFVAVFLFTALLLLVYVFRRAVVYSSYSSGPGDFVLLANEVTWSKSALKSYQMSQGLNQRVYGIIFDAGSTGSRIHIYEFNYTVNAAQPFTLIGELFQQVKPGLSAYANRPGEAAQSLRPLVAAALRRIPAKLHSMTPMALRATAGLRMLSTKATERILEEVTNYLRSTPFHLVQNGVTIMDGLDEGVFAWLTLNFLSNRIPNNAVEKSVTNTFGALDLGGGSTQITYLPGSVYEKDGERPLSPIYLHYIQLAGGHRMQLYSHSYLGLGLMAARFNLLGGGKFKDGVTEDKLESPCMPQNHKSSWDYNGKTYHIQSSKVQQSAAYQATRFSACYESAQDMFTETFLVDHPRELNTKEFFAFSYFYDKAVESGLIGEKDGGRIQLSDFFLAAQKACTNTVNVDPFLCMDLSYIVALLHDGYRFKKSTSIYLRKKISDVELTWGLGAMFDVLYKYQLA